MLPTRRQKILSAIVDQYIATGEPVGSKTLLSKLDISCSSATIRNDMAALTKLGYIYQPHTSAGRIPTQAGYRYYVDHLMKVHELGAGERRQIEAGVDAHSSDPDTLLTHACEALEELTNFAVVAATPADENAIIRNIEMVPVSAKTCVIVLLTSTGVLKSKACRLGSPIQQETIDTFHWVVGEQFVGRELSEVSMVMVQTAVASQGAQALTMLPLLTTVYDLVKSASRSSIQMGGQSRLLDYKDYGDSVTELLNFLHESGPMSLLIDDADDTDDVEVRIGTENKYRELGSSTTIISHYRIGDGATGAIGIIGPTRMNYSKLIPGIKYLSEVVSHVLSEVYEEDLADGDREQKHQSS